MLVLTFMRKKRESFLRTAKGCCYDEAHQKAGGASEASRFFPTTK
jgi:hypothetical protein